MTTVAEPDPVDARFEAVKALNAALAAAQGEFGPIKKQATVETNAYTFKYATLDAILDACRPALAKHGLSVTQRLEDIGNRPGLRTELRHKDGGVLGSSFPLLYEPSTVQQLGSLLTYLRRYALVALLGVASEDDDDGKRATDGKAKTPAKKIRTISDQQRERLWTIARKAQVADDEVRRIVLETAGVESTSDIPVANYDAVVEQIAAAGVPF